MSDYFVNKKTERKTIEGRKEKNEKTDRKGQTEKHIMHI